MPQRDYAPGEIATRGEELLERDVYPNLPEEESGRFIVIDVETGEYEIAETDIEATSRLSERRPPGAFYGVRIGENTAFRTGLVHITPYQLGAGCRPSALRVRNHEATT